MKFEIGSRFSPPFFYSFLLARSGLRLKLLCFICACALCCSPCFSFGQSPDDSPPPAGIGDWNQPAWWEAVNTGNRLWEKGDEEGAINHWQEAVDKGFRDGTVYYHLGMYYHRHGDWKKAADYLSLAKPWIERPGEDAAFKGNLYLALAGSYLKLGREGEAFIHYQKALRVDPDSSPVLLGLSRLYLRRGELKLAESTAKKALSHQPDLAQAYSILAQVSARENDYKSAARFYRKVLEIDPGWWEKRLALALLLHYQSGKEAEAEGELKKVLDRAPASALARAVLSEVYLLQGKESSARKEAEEALKLEPDNYQALIILGQIYLRGGDPGRAEKYFQNALQTDPEGGYAYYGLGVIALQRDRLKEAEARFRKALRDTPLFPEAAYNLGVLLVKTGRREEAEMEFNNILEYSPDFALAHIGLGKLFYLRKDLSRAVAFFKNALSLDRSSWEAFYFLGKCFHNQERFAEAREYFLAARPLAPSNPAIYNALGLTYEKIGNPELAQQSYREALGHDSGYLPAIFNLADLENRRKNSGEATILYRQALILEPGQISWGYPGEEEDFLSKITASLEDYLSSGVDYLSLFRIITNVSRTGSIFPDLIPLLEEKVKANPFETRFLHLLGWAYQEIGEADRGEKCYLRALEVDSDFAIAHLNLGQLYASQGRFALARPHLEAFLTLSPDSPLISAVNTLLKEGGEIKGTER